MDRPIVIFDLSRTKPPNVLMDTMYSTIENVKNGIFTSVKYEPETYVGSIPHVVVFANFFPDLTSLSIDRWRLLRITERQDLVFMDTSQVLRISERLNFHRVQVELSKRSNSDVKLAYLYWVLHASKFSSYHDAMSSFFELPEDERKAISKLSKGMKINIQPDLFSVKKSQFKLPDELTFEFDNLTIHYQYLIEPGFTSFLEAPLLPIVDAMERFIPEEDYAFFTETNYS
jgi:hypothetical protein